MAQQPFNQREDPKDEDRGDIRRPPQAAPDDVDPREARGGRRGSPVLWVLAASIVLALLIWATVHWYGEAIDPPTPAGGLETNETGAD